MSVKKRGGCLNTSLIVALNFESDSDIFLFYIQTINASKAETKISKLLLQVVLVNAYIEMCFCIDSISKCRSVLVVLRLVLVYLV